MKKLIKDITVNGKLIATIEAANGEIDYIFQFNDLVITLTLLNGQFKGMEVK